MLICVIAAVVFGFLAIFSVRYRIYAHEAFHCVFRLATLRKCDTEFDKKMRAAIVGRLVRWPRLAGIVHRRFEAIAWAFVIILFASFGYTGYSIYNLFAWGSCEPGGTCIFVQTDAGLQCVLGDVPAAAHIYFDPNAPVMFFYHDGCPWCARQMAVLAALAAEGYCVRPMHLNANPGLLQQYDIQVVPTFIGPDGNRLNGYQDAAALRAFLDRYE